MNRHVLMWTGILLSVVVSGSVSHRAADAETRALELINKHLAAVGGLEALGEIRDYTMKGTARVSVMAQGFNGDLTFMAKVPARWRETFKSPYFEGDSGCDGRHLWVIGEGQVRKVSPLQEKIELEFAGMKILTGPPRTGWKARYLGRETVSGKDALVIELTSPSGRQARYYLDAESYLLLRSVVPAYNPMMRAETEGTTEFQKYRRVGKLMLPHWIFTSNGFLSKEIDVQEWKFNTGLSDSLFEMPKVERHDPETIKSMGNVTLSLLPG